MAEQPSVKAIATSQITLSAPQTVDGVSIIAADRVLVVGQTTASQNGVYLANAAGWTRAADTIEFGSTWRVEDGTPPNKLSRWTSLDTTPTVGTTALTFARRRHGAAA